MLCSLGNLNGRGKEVASGRKALACLPVSQPATCLLWSFLDDLFLSSSPGLEYLYSSGCQTCTPYVYGYIPTSQVSTCHNSQPPIARCLSGSFHSCPHLLSGALSSLIRSPADLSQSRDGWMPQATHPHDKCAV
ncbi:hypothetical protein CGRA01v4_10749 [Colletotrichum graminicola]|nr:hypothetical protein CGRA01v4_10749 [Colletotrichum graminicola]